MGPISISVVDPVKITGDDYTVILDNLVKNPQGAVTSYLNWTVICNSCVNEDTLVSSSKSIDVGVEQLFPNHGFSLKLNQVISPTAVIL